MGALSYEVTDNDGIQGIKTGDKYDKVAKLAINPANTDKNGNPDTSPSGGQSDEKGTITIQVKLEGGTKYKPTEFKYTVKYQ